MRAGIFRTAAFVFAVVGGFATPALLGGCKKKTPAKHDAAAIASASAATSASAKVAPAASAPKPATPFERACAADHERSANEAKGCVWNDAYDQCVAIDDTHGWFAKTSAIDFQPNAYGENWPQCSFEWQLVYLDAAGRRDATKPEKAVSMYGQEGLIRILAAGNGTVFTETTTVTPSGGHNDQNHGDVYVAKDGKIERLAGIDARTVRDVKDIDGDGALDFLIASPFSVSHQKDAFAIPLSEWVEGPQLIAHRLPDGSVSRDDSVAQSLARKVCPAAPPAKAPAIEKPDPEGGLLSAGTSELFGPVEMWVACSKLWGVPKRSVMKGLPCKSFVSTYDLDGDPSASEKVANGVCPSHLREWADVKPPFVLN